MGLVASLQRTKGLQVRLVAWVRRLVQAWADWGGGRGRRARGGGGGTFPGKWRAGGREGVV